MKKYKKHLILVVSILLGLFLIVFVGGNIYYDKISPVYDIKLGVSFSENYATSIGLDWKQTYLDLLTNVRVKRVRLNSYWTNIEPKPGAFQFQNLDFLLNEAQKHNVKVLLVVGAKQPGWPECHIPTWALKLSVKDRQQQTLNLVKTVVEKYKNHPEIWGWQIENEPLFDYGSHCDPPDRGFLKQEADLVKKIDPARPIVITDSGELRPWRTPMQLSNIFGTTLYRKVYNPLFGYFYWPLTPAMYRWKSELVRTIFAQNNDKTIIAELQTEPWLPDTIDRVSITSQITDFSVTNFKNNVTFAKKTGFDEVYLWGTEWWYYMAKHNHPEYLEYAKSIFQNSEE